MVSLIEIQKHGRLYKTKFPFAEELIDRSYTKQNKKHLISWANF